MLIVHTGPEKHRLCSAAKKWGKIFVFPGDKNLQSVLSFVPQNPLLYFLPPTLSSPRRRQLWDTFLYLCHVAHMAVHLWACSFSRELGVKMRTNHVIAPAWAGNEISMINPAKKNVSILNSLGSVHNGIAIAGVQSRHKLDQRLWGYNAFSKEKGMLLILTITFL
jgi:hypothetical protein